VGELNFRATLQKRGPAAAVVLDQQQVAAVGEGAKRFPVLATVNGHTWRATVARMHGELLVGLSREVRGAAGVEAGDEVAVNLSLDTAPREVTVPGDLGGALAADEQARAAFDALAYTHRKEYVRWIEDAKRPETRARRLTQTLERLHSGLPRR
jgi:hypothetical protein